MDAVASEPQRRLYKSRQNRIIDGVCGGIAEYFGIDPTIVRILWVLVALLGGTGFFLYIAAMIIMPTNPGHSTASGQDLPAPNHTDRRRFWGILLVLLGAFILLLNLGWIANIGWWSISGSIILPVLLILLGLALIYSFTRPRESTAPPAPAGASPAETDQPAARPVTRELRRSISDRKIFGVCGGLGQYFGFDSTIVRILFILLILASVGWGLILYIILAIVMPEERPTTKSA